MEVLERLLPFLIVLVLFVAAWMTQHRWRARPHPPEGAGTEAARGGPEPSPSARPSLGSGAPQGADRTPSPFAPVSPGPARAAGPAPSGARRRLRRILRDREGRRLAILAHEILRRPP